LISFIIFQEIALTRLIVMLFVIRIELPLSIDIDSPIASITFSLLVEDVVPLPIHRLLVVANFVFLTVLNHFPLEIGFEIPYECYWVLNPISVVLEGASNFVIPAVRWKPLVCTFELGLEESLSRIRCK
jgi:hypothetical protein